MLMGGEFFNLLVAKAGGETEGAKDWLLSNVKNLSRYAIVTHVGKYTQPGIDSKVSFWDSTSANSDTGYLTTAGTGKRQDIAVDGGARYTGLASVLVRDLTEGKTLLEHFQEDTPLIREEVTALGVDYEALRHEILAIKKAPLPKRSDPALRQIYFPVGNDAYHLLSLMPSTTTLTAIRDAVRERQDCERKSRDKKAENYGQSYTVIPHPVKVKVGGDNPQNLSCFNILSSMYMLLPSGPPLLTLRKLRLPRRDFFFNTIPRDWQKDLFLRLRDWMQNEHMPRLAITEAIQEIGIELAGGIQLLAGQLQGAPPGWSDTGNLPDAQKLWLDAKYAAAREENLDWMDEISMDFARWIARTYKRHAQLKKDAIPFGDAEQQYFAEILQVHLKEEVRSE